MRLLKASAHRRMTWKNGGGETTEIAVHPPGAGLPDFGWRVSVATVAVDGPFSVFDGVDRTLAILHGEGVDLDIEGIGRRRLTAASDPLFFPADRATTARLLAGPITDLNVMTRRGVFTHRLRRLARRPFEARGRRVLLLAVTGASVVVEGRTVPLEPFDTLVLEGGATIALSEGGDADAIRAVEIDAVS